MAPHTQKSKEITIAIPPGDSLANTVTFANRFYIEEFDDHVVAYFGFVSNLRLESPSLAVAIARIDIQNSKSTWEKYIQDCGITPPEAVLWRPVALEKVWAANALLFSRTGETAETTFSAFSTHELANLLRSSTKPSNGEVALKVIPLVTIRSPLPLQLQLLICLLSNQPC